ncbi:GMC family oxidoreductase N-terminal domain-containing protein [Defluviimonas sp. D31]|uniref:GMC family oxidoreductase n=1 Tax=Defluviimonas sp. D31 TaxID=3083253 RepID=UPI00296EFEDA|nr:GMC oxidoreductase [Defluviimonas sp. D31]MDW4551190.1 GMC family oxidoreductase N-terminal domain-containing protein [Defluviimonas sp. D31]
MTSFDYIVAGGGSAGCALAARLAENPDVTVALIEAGGRGRDLFIRMPAGNGFIFGNPKHDWGYSSVPQAALGGRRIYYARGRGLGGSSIMNGMIYMRGVPADYDGWRQMGLPGWSHADLLPYFRRSEGARDRRDPWHGVGGPLKTELSANFGTLDQAFIDAAQATGHRLLDDFNGPDRTGVARTDSTVHRGIRQSSAIAYLGKQPGNLTVLTHRQVARITFEGIRATGVETVTGERFEARREVILCQGAFATPQTLMLSGIGPAAHLAAHGIPVVADLPGVGAHLADHVDVSMQYGSDRMDLSLARHQRLDKAAALMANWLLFKRGPGGGAFFSAVLFHAFDDPALPELEVFMTPMIVEENLTNGDRERTPWSQWLGRKLLVRGRKVAKPGVQIDINQERPRSLGTVRLASADPRAHPLIDPNYYADPRDLKELVDGVKVMREVMAQPQIARFVTGELEPWRNARTDAEIEAAVRATTYTGHHPCSTARMGGDHDPMAVLDAGLRVRGVEGLRVCDASAMPTQITGNLNATVIAMAEKAADLILDRAAPAPEFPSEHPKETAA